MANKFGIKISKPGISVVSAEPKDLVFSTQFNTLKILRTGTLSVSLPAENVNNTSRIRTATYTHNLGYIPMFLPMVQGIVSDFTSTATVIVNDAEETEIPPAPYGPGTSGETSRVYVTDTQIVLEVNRYNLLPFNEAMVAKTVTVYYTLFWDQVDNEFNVL